MSSIPRPRSQVTAATRGRGRGTSSAGRTSVSPGPLVYRPRQWPSPRATPQQSNRAATPPLTDLVRGVADHYGCRGGVPAFGSEDLPGGNWPLIKEYWDHENNPPQTLASGHSTHRNLVEPSRGLAKILGPDFMSLIPKQTLYNPYELEVNLPGDVGLSHNRIHDTYACIIERGGTHGDCGGPGMQLVEALLHIRTVHAHLANIDTHRVEYKRFLAAMYMLSVQPEMSQK